MGGGDDIWPRLLVDPRAFDGFADERPVLHDFLLPQHVHDVRAGDGDGLLATGSSHLAGPNVRAPVRPRDVHVVTVLLQPPDLLVEFLEQLVDGDLLLALEILSRRLLL